MKSLQKSLVFLLALVFLSVSLLACGGTGQASTSENTSPPEDTTNTPPDDPQIPKTEYKIVMIGNSLTGSANLYPIYNAISKETGIHFDVQTFIKGGTQLNDVIPIARQSYEDKLHDADVIFFQDFYYTWPLYGNPSHNMDPNMKKLIQDIGPDKNYYFYLFMYDFDELNRGYETTQTEDGKAYADTGISHFIDLYDVEPLPMHYYTNMLIRLGYISKDTIIIKNDLHPNPIYGFFMGQVIYVSLTGESCVGVLSDYLFEEEWDGIAGETMEEKAETLKKIQEQIDKMVKDYQTAVERYRAGEADNIYLPLYP